ncbi:YT521-B-like domain-containing protein [Apodospora peruviana]|uniref:YT521-B-like domain-containing protein n=1 Tax=Apodospora peruviana TaxID=516989 RepID=A0AAE0I0V2_9PEZI|nr:YT521-B-like domain-containing protein [Apodospora peruviana]
MSSPSQTTKLDLDALTAELKEKLLKSRGQSQARVNSSSPANDTSKAKIPGLSIVTAPSGRPSERKLGKPSPNQFVPHQIPKPPPQTSIAADMNDITAFISSISSNTRDNIPTSTNDADNQNPKTADRQAVSTYDENQRSSQKTKPPSQPSSANSANSSMRPPACSPREEGEVSTSDKDRVGPSTIRKQLPGNPPTPTEFKVKGIASSASAANKVRDTTSERNDRLASDYREQRRPGPATSQTTAQTRKTDGSEKSANSGGHGKTDDAANGDSRNRQAPNTIANTTPTIDALVRILEQDADLRDWLIMTDYNDIQVRNRKLERYRKVKALAAEKERIEQEQQKLMEEEELELGMRRSIAAPAPSVTPVATPAPNSANSIPFASSKPTTEQSETTQVIPAKRVYPTDNETTESSPEKAPRIEQRPTPQEHLNARVEDRQRDRDIRADPNPSDTRPGTFGARPCPSSNPSPSPRRQGPPPSPPRPLYRQQYRNSPPPRPREYSPHRQGLPPLGPRFRPEQYDEFHDRSRRYDSYRGDTNRRVSPSFDQRRGSGGRFSPPPHDLDLGRPGETRFFMVKSFNEDNVRKCMEDGVWATQTKNGQVLTSAFANCKNVILFFSINKSRAFQGYARMKTAPSPDTPRPKWMNSIHWDTSPPFRVEWLSRVPVEFFRIGHLKNSYNENQPVLVGKDGQEIEEECGRQLLYEMQSYVDAKNGVESSLWSSMGPGGGHGKKHGFGGGRGNGYHRRGGSHGGPPLDRERQREREREREREHERERENERERGRDDTTTTVVGDGRIKREQQDW